MVGRNPGGRPGARCSAAALCAEPPLANSQTNRPQGMRVCTYACHPDSEDVTLRAGSFESRWCLDHLRRVLGRCLACGHHQVRTRGCVTWRNCILLLLLPLSVYPPLGKSMCIRHRVAPLHPPSFIQNSRPSMSLVVNLQIQVAASRSCPELVGRRQRSAEQRKRKFDGGITLRCKAEKKKKADPSSNVVHNRNQKKSACYIRREESRNERNNRKEMPL